MIDHDGGQAGAGPEAVRDKSALRERGADMPDETRHESADLEDYSVQEPSDSLTGDPGDPGGDPLDRGVAPPERWSAGMRFGVTADEQQAGESLDQLLSEEEPEPALGFDDDGPDPRAGRLVAQDEGAHPDVEADLVAHDAGIDGGAATAEEAAVHVVADNDTDIRSGDPAEP
jgi:hypothetical protein